MSPLPLPPAPLSEADFFGPGAMETGGGNAGMLLLVWGEPGPPMDPQVWSALPRKLLHRVVERLPVTSLLDWARVDSYWRAWLRSTPTSKLAITPAAAAGGQHSMLVYGADGVRTPPGLPGSIRCHRLSLAFLPPGSRPVASQGGLLVFHMVPANPRQVAVCNPLTRRWSRLPEVVADSPRERPRITRADLRVRGSGGSTVYRVGVDVWKRPGADAELFGSSQARALWAFDPAACRWKEFGGASGSDRADDYFFKLPTGNRGANAGMVMDGARNRVYSLGRLGMQVAVLPGSAGGGQQQRVGKAEVLPPMVPGQDADFHKLLLHKGKVVLVGYNMAPFWVFVWEMDFRSLAWKQVGFVNKAACCGPLLPASFWTWQPDAPDEKAVWDSVGVAGLGDMVCVSLVAHQALFVLALDVVTRAWRAWDFSPAPHLLPPASSTGAKRLSLLSFSPTLTASPYLKCPRAMPPVHVARPQPEAASVATAFHEQLQAAAAATEAAGAAAAIPSPTFDFGAAAEDTGTGNVVNRGLAGHGLLGNAGTVSPRDRLVIDLAAAAVKCSLTLPARSWSAASRSSSSLFVHDHDQQGGGHNLLMEPAPPVPGLELDVVDGQLSAMTQEMTVPMTFSSAPASEPVAPPTSGTRVTRSRSAAASNYKRQARKPKGPVTRSSGKGTRASLPVAAAHGDDSAAAVGPPVVMEAVTSAVEEKNINVAATSSKGEEAGGPIPTSRKRAPRARKRT